NIYDEFLLPTLVLAKQDRERGDLPVQEEHYIYEVTREFLDELVYPQQQRDDGADGEPPPMVLVFGCPARDEGDETALYLFRQYAASKSCELEVFSRDTLSAEIVNRINEEHPAAVCIASLPPGGVSHARYLCKRLRGHFPELKILVGRWGQKDGFEE